MFKFNDDQKKEKETQDTYMNPLAFLIDTLTKEGFGVFNIPRLSLQQNYKDWITQHPSQLIDTAASCCFKHLFTSKMALHESTQAHNPINNLSHEHKRPTIIH